MRKINQVQQGFTLLELVVVVALLGLITSLATNYVVEDSVASRLKNTESSRLAIKQALEAYYRDNGNKFPESLSQLVEGSSPYLLDVQFEVCKDASGNVVNKRTVLRDGWGNQYCETDSSTNLYKNFGWIYVGDAFKTVSTAESANSADLVKPSTDNVVYLRSLGPTDSTEDVFPLIDFPLTTASAARVAVVDPSAKRLYRITSGAEVSIQCRNASGGILNIGDCIE